MLKRTFDILSSGLVLLILSPLLLLIALWIRLDSRGPALFLQQRIGRDRIPFRIFKFRTMVDRDPDSIDQNRERVVSEGSDPRITRAGRFLRATSLDELPQLLNILKGDMSVVGPRPVIPEQVEVVPVKYLSRFDTRPGLTGLAQVRGRRSLGWLEQLAADAEYVRRQSFLFDMAIILQTVGVIFGRKGIYAGEAQNWRAYRDNLRAGDSNQSVGRADEERTLSDDDYRQPGNGSVCRGGRRRTDLRRHGGSWQGGAPGAPEHPQGRSYPE